MNAFEEQEYTKQFDFGLWKKFFRYTKPYKRRFIMLAFIMMAVGGVDAIFPLMSKYAIDHFIIPGKLEGLWGFGLLYAVIMVVQACNVAIASRRSRDMERAFSPFATAASHSYQSVNTFTEFRTVTIGLICI